MFHFGGESVSLRSKNAAMIYVRNVLWTHFVADCHKQKPILVFSIGSHLIMVINALFVVYFHLLLYKSPI